MSLVLFFVSYRRQMCYNERASWISLFIGSIAIYAAVRRANRTNRSEDALRALSFIPIVVIQLYEAILYRYCSSDAVSTTMRQILLFTIFLQPIALMMSAMNFADRVTSASMERALRVFMGIYVLSLVVDPPVVTASDKACGKWMFQRCSTVTGITYHVLLLSALAIPRCGSGILFGTGLATLIASCFLGTDQPSKWCILAATTPVLLNVV